MQGWLFLTFIMVGSLLGITGLRQFFIDPLPTTTLNTVWFFVQVLPLLLCLPSALRGQLKGMFFLCLVSTLYFIHGVLNVFDPTLFYWGGCRDLLCTRPMWHYRTVRTQAARI